MLIKSTRKKKKRLTSGCRRLYFSQASAFFMRFALASTRTQSFRPLTLQHLENSSSVSFVLLCVHCLFFLFQSDIVKFVPTWSHFDWRHFLSFHYHRINFLPWCEIQRQLDSFCMTLPCVSGAAVTKKKKRERNSSNMLFSHCKKRLLIRQRVITGAALLIRHPLKALAET